MCNFRIRSGSHDKQRNSTDVETKDFPLIEVFYLTISAELQVPSNFEFSHFFSVRRDYLRLSLNI
jgi:hypothetical protein